MEQLLKSNKKRIEFIINKEAKIYVNASCGIARITCCDFSEVILVQKKNITIIAPYEPVLYNLRELYDALEKILFEDGELPNQIGNIGLMHQKIVQKSQKETPYIQHEGFRSWVGFEFNLWRMPGSNFTWLYVQNGFIKLTISRVYPWSLNDVENIVQPAYSFENFIENYQPIADYTLDRKTALEWLKQADYCIKIIEKNTEEHHKS